MIRSRQIIDAAVEKLFLEHHTALAEAAGKASKTGIPPAQNGEHQDNDGLRKGVAPGSFIDLLIRTNDRATGQAFSDGVLAQQVMHLRTITAGCFLPHRGKYEYRPWLQNLMFCLRSPLGLDVTGCCRGF